MGTYVLSSYVRVPSDLNADEVLLDIHSHLLRACELDPGLAYSLRHSSLQHELGAGWIRLHEGGFRSLKDSDIIEVLRSITQKYVDEVVMLSCLGVVSFGAYGHFVEGDLVRFTAACEDWTESTGTPEEWEGELLTQTGGLNECTIWRLGKELQLPGFGRQPPVWHADIPLFR